MNAKHPVTQDTLCYSIERIPIEDKYFLVIKEKYRTYIISWLQNVASKIDKDDFDWNKYTGCKNKYRFTWKERNDIHSQYTNSLLQLIDPGTDNVNTVATPPKASRRIIRKLITFKTNNSQA